MKIAIPKYNQLNDVKAFMLYVIKNDFHYDFNPDWHWDIENLESTYLNKKSILYIAVEEGEVVGTIAARPYDKDYPSLKGRYSKADTLGIWRHYVKSEWRGKGVGTKLLSELENRSRELGFKNLYLHTQKTISGSLEYWIAKGYKIVEDTGDELQTVHLEKKLI